MSEQNAPAWTKEELQEFDRLIDKTSSRINSERVSGRLALSRFVEQHGKEKCDAMWAYLEGGGGCA